jgi:DNA-binding GntR family transcriptional regulator
MDADSRKIPSHEITYARLRDMILYGHLAPGAPVTIQGLITELDAGMTPVREAFARLAIEPKLAELAAPKLTGGQIDRLEAIDGAVNRAIEAGNLPDYLAANHAFHFALYEAAEAPVLLDLARSLWLRAGPSLRAVIDRYGREAAPDLHRVALVAMRAGDAQGLARAIEQDIQQGVDHIRQALAEGN